MPFTAAKVYGGQACEKGWPCCAHQCPLTMCRPVLCVEQVSLVKFRELQSYRRVQMNLRRGDET